MNVDAGTDKARMRLRGPCLRCGWTSDIYSISKRESRILTGEKRFTRLCDECITEFSGDRVHPLVGVHQWRRKLLATHRRSVA